MTIFLFNVTCIPKMFHNFIIVPEICFLDITIICKYHFTILWCFEITFCQMKIYTIIKLLKQMHFCLKFITLLNCHATRHFCWIIKIKTNLEMKYYHIIWKQLFRCICVISTFYIKCCLIKLKKLVHDISPQIKRFQKYIVIITIFHGR